MIETTIKAIQGADILTLLSNGKVIGTINKREIVYQKWHF